MQSIGASEKVFQLMDLLPSDQFTSKGKYFTNYADVLDVHILLSWGSPFHAFLLKKIIKSVEIATLKRTCIFMSFYEFLDGFPD